MFAYNEVCSGHLNGELGCLLLCESCCELPDLLAHLRKWEAS